MREGIESFLAGDVETGKTVLCDYINATVGFNELAEATHRSSKSLMRRLGPSGNPQARNLFEIVISPAQGRCSVQAACSGRRRLIGSGSGD